jgi:hypothetical protein
VDVAKLEQRFIAAIASFPEPARVELVRILELGARERAAEIGRLHASGEGAALVELLIDLEENARARGIVLAELHNQTRR